MPQRKPAQSGAVIFTDLDGTLLDDAYSWRPARPALALCRRLGVEVVLVSSKTRAEMEPLHRRLGLRSPIISENGCGVFFPAGQPRPPAPSRRVGSWWMVSLGRPYQEVVRQFRGLRRRLGWQMLGFSDLNPTGIQILTGLGAPAAQRAARREFDEPFTLAGLSPAELARLQEEAQAVGLTLQQGGRFHHLHGGPGKGAAVALVLRWLKGLRPITQSVALGDAPNDLDMLAAVDLPVLVASSRLEQDFARVLPGLRRTVQSGPAGWNEAVLAILGRPPRAGDAPAA